MKKYSTVFFDLFDTIINFNFKKLPAVDMNGIRSRTTSKEVYAVFSRYYPKIRFTAFYPPFIESYHRFQEMKLEEFREYPNRDRFKLMLNIMNIEPTGKSTRMIEEMVTAHMDGLASCVVFPEENKKILERIKTAGYVTAIVSNFDYAPTAYALIQRHGIRKYFDDIVISEEVGWRKPKPAIFHRALELTNKDPGEVLFVGDNYGADVAGAKSAGIDAVWLNTKNRSTNDLTPPPDYVISALPQLDDILL